MGEPACTCDVKRPPCQCEDLCSWYISLHTGKRVDAWGPRIFLSTYKGKEDEVVRSPET